jgi:hypothetical protein
MSASHVRQPWKFLVKLSLWGHNFSIFWSKWGTIGDRLFFCLPIPIWGLGKQQILKKNILETLGDALIL